MTWGGFAQPAWLWGLLSLAVPIALHWLSRGEPRRVPFASVRLLTGKETSRWRRLQLRRWALLAMRCLLLSLLAIGLAEPRLGFGAGEEPPAWLLVEPEVMAAREALEPTQPDLYADLDRLLATGAEARWWSPGLASMRELTAEEAVPRGSREPDLWALLELTDLEAPAGASLVAVTLDRSTRFRGRRPRIARDLDWKSVIDRRENRWLEAVSDRPDGVWVAESGPSRVDFSRDEAAFERAADGELRALPIAGSDAAADDDRLVPPEYPAVSVALHTGEGREDDGRLVRRRLETAAEVAGLELEFVEADGSVEERSGLAFWLSPEPVPDGWLERPRGSVLVSDVLERHERCDCSADSAPFFGARFRRIGPVETVEGALRIEVGTADPLLTLARAGDGRWYRLASRFHPAWSEWSEGDALTAWLAELLIGLRPVASSEQAGSDRRRVSGLGRPLSLEASDPFAPAERWPRAWWLLLWLGLMIERVWATGGGDDV